MEDMLQDFGIPQCMDINSITIHIIHITTTLTIIIRFDIILFALSFSVCYCTLRSKYQTPNLFGWKLIFWVLNLRRISRLNFCVNLKYSFTTISLCLFYYLWVILSYILLWYLPTIIHICRFKPHLVWNKQTKRLLIYFTCETQNKWRMLKAPPLISKTYIFSVL